MKKAPRPFFSLPQWLGALVMNYFSLLHVLGVLMVALAPWPHVWERVLATFVALYGVPPLLCRLIRLLFPIREGRIPLGSKDYFVWWATFCLQSLFCRLPFLEETLRIVPGLYNQWLRLWGSKIGRLTYWGGGTMVLDRAFLNIGNDVVFGAGVRLNPHVIERKPNGQNELILATVTVGDNAMIGGYSLLTAGTNIGPNENPRACLLCPPFTIWRNGRRVKSETTVSNEPSEVEDQK